MPYQFETAIKIPYRTVPVPKDFIASRCPPSPANGTSAIPQNEEPELKPQILWVGCSDSLVIETECLGVRRDEIFVHRDLGNILSNGDLSSRSAVEWAVGLLGVSFCGFSC